MRRLTPITWLKTILIAGRLCAGGLCAAGLLAGALMVTAGCVPADRSVDAGGPSAEPRRDVVEYWYRLDVDGTPAGWMLIRESAHGEQLTSTTRLQLRFKRAESAQTMELESRFVETLDGQPLRAWSRQTLGLTPIETTWEFLPHEVVVDVTHGDTSRSQRVPLPRAGWLTPGQIQPQLRRLLADGVEHFTVSSLDPQLGLEVVDTEWILDAEEEALQIDEKTVLTRRFRQRQSSMPQLETMVNVTDDGLTVRSSTPMMGFTMTSTLSRRELALESSDGPELMARTFIYPDRPIASPRRAVRARYELRATGAGKTLPLLPSIGAQRTSRLPSSGEAGEALEVLVDVGSSPISERPDLEPYLRASTFVDHHSPGVRRLLTEALEAPEASSEAPPAQRAESLRAFVSRYLRDKNLDSILATAGEVAASRSGDCTEHSVLLTALLRAADIPARAVTGLVYVEAMAGERDLFGYHMWTQAWVDDRWLDLDATLTTAFDAAHIAFGTTALNDDHATLKELARLATFIGQAEIRVLEVE